MNAKPPRRRAWNTPSPSRSSDAPAGPHEWLTKHVFVGIAKKLPTSNCIDYFQVL